MSETQQIPEDATHRYRCPHQGATFIKMKKDHYKDGSYVTAIAWSNTTLRWRKRAERINPECVAAKLT